MIHWIKTKQTPSRSLPLHWHITDKIYSLGKKKNKKKQNQFCGTKIAQKMHLQSSVMYFTGRNSLTLSMVST